MPTPALKQVQGNQQHETQRLVAMIAFVYLVDRRPDRTVLHLVDCFQALFLGTIQKVHYLVEDAVAARLPRGRDVFNVVCGAFQQVAHLPVEPFGRIGENVMGDVVDVVENARRFFGFKFDFFFLCHNGLLVIPATCAERCRSKAGIPTNLASDGDCSNRHYFFVLQAGTFMDSWTSENSKISQYFF